MRDVVITIVLRYQVAMLLGCFGLNRCTIYIYINQLQKGMKEEAVEK